MCFCEACRENDSGRWGNTHTTTHTRTHTEAAFEISCWGREANEGECESDGQGKAEIADVMLMDGLTFVLLG